MRKLLICIPVLALMLAGCQTSADIDHDPDIDKGTENPDGNGDGNGNGSGGTDQTWFAARLGIINDERPSLSTVLNEDGSLKWTVTDELALMGVTGSNNTGKLRFTTSEEGLRHPDHAAVFTGDIPNTDIGYLVHYPYEAGEPNGAFYIFTLPDTQIQGGYSSDHIGKYDVLLGSTKVTFTDNGDQYVFDDLQFSHLYAMLEMELVNNNPTQPLAVHAVEIYSEQGAPVFYRQHTWNGTVISNFNNASTRTDKLVLEISQPVTLSAERFIARMMIPQISGATDMTVSVVTELGRFKITKSTMDFNRGSRYGTLIVLDHTLLETESSFDVSSASDWNSAVQRGGSAQLLELNLKNDITLDDNSLIPACPVKISGTGTLTFNQTTRAGSTFSNDYSWVVPNTHPSVNFGGQVEFDGITVVNNGVFIHCPELTITDNTKLNGQGRYIVDGTLNLVGDKNITNDIGIVISCDHFNWDGYMTNNGSVYYNSVNYGMNYDDFNGTQPRNANQSGNTQVPHSNFDSWTKGNKLVYYVGTSSNTVWASGTEGTGDVILSSLNTSTLDPETNFVVSGQAANVHSAHIKGSMVDKFAAGNLFTGKFGGVDIWTQVATMTFGTPFYERPQALEGYLHYTSGVINKTGSGDSGLNGQRDAYTIYVALSTKAYDAASDKPNSYPDLENHNEILAYGQYTSPRASSPSANEYEKFRIELQYKDHGFVTKPSYILITVNASAGGANFTGSTSSKLLVDEFVLEY